MTGIFFNGPWEWIIILVIAMLLFGHRIPGMARSMGAGITEFKRGLKGGADGADDSKSVEDSSSEPTSEAKKDNS